MQFHNAGVADVLRLSQRDDSFVREMQDNIQSIAKLFGFKNIHKNQKVVPTITNVWYYLMTTFGGLQTLGEEYTGSLRVNGEHKIPSKLAQLLWMSFFIGGEPLIDGLIQSLQRRLKQSNDLTEQAQTVLLKTLEFLRQHKQALARIHHSLFYINGKYYNISNRLMGIRYVLVRQWLQDNTFSRAFRFLGHLSLFYVVFNFAQDLWSFVKKNERINENPNGADALSLFRKGCVLCGENRKNSSSTPCGHVFCWECIYDSLKYQQNCPICREAVPPSRIIFLQNYV